jgi:copper(I)-binding protein
MQSLRLLAVFILGLNFNLALADESLQVSDAWVRASAPGQQVGAAYMTLQSKQALTVTKVESSAAGSVEIHKMTMKDGIMRMRMREKLELETGKPFALEPGGFHLMLFDLKKPLKAGESVPFVLHLQDAQGKADTIELSAPVKASN